MRQERRAGERRSAIERRRRRAPVAVDKRVVADRRGAARFEVAAVVWLARLSLERPGVGLGDLREGLVAFEAMPYNRDAARSMLGALCERLGMRDAARRLRGPPP